MQTQSLVLIFTSSPPPPLSKTALMYTAMPNAQVPVASLHLGIRILLSLPSEGFYAAADQSVFIHF